MEEYKIEIPVRKKLIKELTPVEAQWRDVAIEVAKKAYAPYSNFRVGAVAVLENGELVTGSNQENAAYPSGLCAERVALFAAGAHYPDVPVRAIAVVAIKDGVIQEQISPCGACRQVLLESEIRNKKAIPILLCGRDEVVFINSVSGLLPLSFGAKNL